MSRPTIHHADVLDWAAAYQGEPYHALLCDPPYHLHQSMTQPREDLADYDGGKGNPYARQQARAGFMGKTWDGGDLAFRSETWAAFLPLLHPGAFAMAFAGSRGWHRMAVAIEDAGFVIHPTMFLWSYGSGFPKAQRIDTQIDAAAGVERAVIGQRNQRFGLTQATGWNATSTPRNSMLRETAPATDLARAWAGHRYGLQAIKPAVEPIIVFQKPYGGRPVEVMTATGAGALNIEAGRIGTTRGVPASHSTTASAIGVTGIRDQRLDGELDPNMGRWPANLLLSHLPECEPIGQRRVRTGTHIGHNRAGADRFTANYGQHMIDPGTDRGYADADGYETVTDYDCAPGCSVAALGAQSGERAGNSNQNLYNRDGGTVSVYGEYEARSLEGMGRNDTGTAARFFYNADWQAERLEAADAVIYRAKASTAEREAGLEDKRPAGYTYAAYKEAIENGRELRRNVHPTIKPISLAEHLARLLLPPSLYAPRRLFVPFAGAGSECIGAMRAGWEHVDGVELEEDHVSLARARIPFWAERGVQLQLSLFDEVA